MFGLSQRCIIVAKNGGKIVINEGVGMSGCTIYSMESITIGRNTDIGSGCKIIDNDFHPLPYSERYPVERLDLLKKRPVVIGEGCFLGANSIILKVKRYDIGKERRGRSWKRCEWHVPR